MHFCILALLLIVFGCSGLEDAEKEKLKKANAIGERIYRTHEEVLFAIEEPKPYTRPAYPWEINEVGGLSRITKEFFRCKGSNQNTPQTKTANGQSVYTFDCGGMTQHSLPYKEGKEIIYPALIELLNYIQDKTQKKVVVTCGHRCPTHNTYADHSKANQGSKHMIGAEVDFYVKGLEWRPQVVINLIMEYYKKHPTLRHDPKCAEFIRYEQATNVSTPPWHNKEVFIKFYTKDEGRDLDNNHDYPYFSLQLKWDRDKNEPITYTWAKAFNGYLRY